MNIVLFGAPGAGKGTLAGRIKKLVPNIVHISTGDLFRYNIKEKTEIGIKAKEFIDAGKLVPDEVVIGMVKNRLDESDVKSGGFMLDGFPRTLNQAKILSEIAKIDTVYVLEVPREIILQRILGRLSCPKCNEIYNKFTLPPKSEGICDKCGGALTHRSDDTEDTLNKRLDTYENNANPVIEFYSESDLITKVDSRNTTKLTDHTLKEVLNL